MNAHDEKNPNAPRRNAGFTLIEVMVVIVILGLLATMVTTSVMEAGDEAKIGTARTSIKTIEGAVERYYLNVGRFPQSLDDLTSEDAKGGPYLKSLEKDPWGNDFQLRGETKKDFEIISYGPDGSEGSEDDISSRKKE